MTSMETRPVSTAPYCSLLQRCASCKKELVLSAGDIIFGDKWYHKNCFRSPQYSKVGAA